MTDATALELRALRAEQAELREDVAWLLRRLLAREDRRLALALMPLAAELVGPRPFTAATLAEAALADRTSLGLAVRELIAEACGDGITLRPLGELLARVEGVPLAGVRLVDAGALHGVRRWRLRPAVGGDGAD